MVLDLRSVAQRLPWSAACMFVGCATCGGPVAPVCMLGTADDGPVVVIVPQIPWFGGVDEVPAPVAGDGAGGYAGCPGSAGAVVVAVVPACLPCASCPVPLPCVGGAAAGAVWDWCGA